MNVVVIGGVAAGTKTAAKLMRQDRSAKVTVYTKSKDISYAGCGLPYYVGGSIESRDELIVNTPAKYTGLTGVEVKTEMEAVGVDAAAKTVTFENGMFVVEGEWLYNLVGQTNFEDYESLNFFQRVLQKSGVFEMLEERGCRDGDSVSIYDFEFDFVK